MRAAPSGPRGLTRRQQAALALPLILLGLAAPAAAARSAAPRLSRLRVSGASLPSSGGTVTISGRVAGASRCTISATPRIARLARSFGCGGRSFRRRVAVPANSTPRTVRYTLTISATRDSRRGRARTRLRVAALPRLSSGELDSCVLENGAVYCWGGNLHGQVGNGKAGEEAVTVATRVKGLGEATSVGVAGETTCATVQGRVYCWGSDEAGQLGSGAPGSEAPFPAPVRTALISGASAVSAGGSFGDDHACALLEAGELACWGWNKYGELGSALGVASASAPQPVADLRGAVQVSAGGADTCATLGDGHVECWGDDFAGEVGNGRLKEIAVRTPSEVLGVSEAREVRSNLTACALLRSGHVACWGSNTNGQVGNGKANEAGVPTATPVSGISEATQVATGELYACALLRSGRVECWGSNASGNLGDGRSGEEEVTTPTPVPGVDDAVELAIGSEGETTCVVLRDGRVECWGANLAGEVGDARLGPEAGVTAPTEVLGLP